VSTPRGSSCTKLQQVRAAPARPARARRVGRLAERHVGRHAVVEEHHVLAHAARTAAAARRAPTAAAARRRASRLPSVGLDEARQQVHERGLARARGPDQGHRLARRARRSPMPCSAGRCVARGSCRPTPLKQQLAARACRRVRAAAFDGAVLDERQAALQRPPARA
jgi:hypothetical protein